MTRVRDSHAEIALRPNGEIIVTYLDQKPGSPFQFYYENVADLKRDHKLMGRFLRKVG